LSVGKLYINSVCELREGKLLKNGVVQQEVATESVSAELRAFYDWTAVPYSKFHKMDGLSKLGWLTSYHLLQDLSLAACAPTEVAVVLANEHSSLDMDERFSESIRTFASPALFVYTLPNIVIGEICIYHQFKGENAFFVQDRMDIPFLMSYIEQLFEEGTTKACILGWVEQYKEQYRSCLYLVENSMRGLGLDWNFENVEKFYK
jgi:hypothetical protein